MNIEKILKVVEEYISPDSIKEIDKAYIMPTFCHNEDVNSASHKLYLYKNEGDTPLFYCYTECSKVMNIYQLVQAAEKTRGRELTYKEAFKKVNGYDYHSTQAKQERPEEVHTEIKFKNPLSVRLQEYPKHVMDLFYIDEIHPWRMEGIDPFLLEKYEIGFSKSMEAVSIPHRDWRGNLIGVRVRNYNPMKMKSGKYMPLHMNNIFHSHPLSLSFFGIFQNQNPIKKARRVYLFEGEKSVLQFEEMFGQSLALAVCGSSISKWQQDFLIHFLGVEEVIIAFDKEYENYSEAFDYVKKIEDKISHLKLFADVKVLIDDKNLFDLKDSPTDKTTEDFLQMKQWKL